MASFLGAVCLLLAVLALSSARSFSSRVRDSQDENIPRHLLVNSFEYPEKVVDVEEKDLRELAEDVIRGREREREKERQKRLEREREREREEERKWRNELRRERERERNRKHETRGMNAQGFSPDTAIPLLSEHDPLSRDHSRGLGKHREREEEIEKERTDHHGRKEEERIQKMERERLRQRKINGKMRKELEKEMRGHRQRLMKIGNQFREQEERFRARSRARGGTSKI